MALFKILHGGENNLPAVKTPGYMYITEDKGNIFIDLSATKRIQLNAKSAVYDGKEQNIANTYIKDLNVSGKNITCVYGDEHSKVITTQDTVYSAGNGLNLSNNVFSLGTSGVAAGTYGPGSNVSGANGTTINVPQISVDAYGRVTSITNRVYTSVNTDTNTDTSVSVSLKNSGNGYVTTCTGSGTGGLNYHNSVYVDHSSGVLMGAAWNDYAEYREVKTEIEPGRIVIETGNGDLVLSQERLAPAPNVVSDTFGFAIGQTAICNTPIAVAGRALVFPFEDRENFKAGAAVCAGPNGTASLMTREEIREYPDRILGIVSEIPNYETWGETNIPVNNRIWIKIK